MASRARKPDPAWRPPSVPDGVTSSDLARHFYVVVEDISDGIIAMNVTPWPTSIEGRPVFSGADHEFEIAATTEDLQLALAERQTAAPPDISPVGLDATESALRVRPIEIGDAFAVPATREAVEAASSSDKIPGAASWIDGPPLDLTADVREAAKLATLRALAPPIDPKIKREMLGEAERTAAAPGGA